MPLENLVSNYAAQQFSKYNFGHFSRKNRTHLNNKYFNFIAGFSPLFDFLNEEILSLSLRINLKGKGCKPDDIIVLKESTVT